jgi:outer membrane protein
MFVHRLTTFVAACLAVSLTTAPAFAADLRIAYVDMEKAFSTSAAGKAAKAKFTRKLDDLTRRIETRETELKQLQDSLEKAAATLSEDTRKDRELAYQNKYRDYQRLVKDSQDDLRREDAELTNRILKSLLEVVEQVGKSGNYTLVLEKKSVLYAADQIDITDQVVAAMDKRPNPVTASDTK